MNNIQKTLEESERLFDEIKITAKIWPDTVDTHKESKEKELILNDVWKLIKPEIQSFLKEREQALISAIVGEIENCARVRDWKPTTYSEMATVDRVRRETLDDIKSPLTNLNK